MTSPGGKRHAKAAGQGQAQGQQQRRDQVEDGGIDLRGQRLADLPPGQPVRGHEHGPGQSQKVVPERFLSRGLRLLPRQAGEGDRHRAQ